MKPFLYERKHQPVLPHPRFVQRLLGNGVVALLVLGVSLFAGMLGYHALEQMNWLDALLNASMILGGMGPVTELKTDGGKLFASLYALYSGLMLIAIGGLLLAPVFHRVLHRFHEEAD